MIKRPKISTSLQITSIILCTAFTACLLITSQIVMATANPIPGIGVTVRKIPGGKKPSSARTNQDGKFTVGNLELGSYKVSLKHATYSPPANVKTLIITIEGVKGGKVEKRFPISELRRGVTLDIEIERSGGMVTGTCMAMDEPGEE